MADASVRLNEEVAAAKVIDGEAVIINVATGRYYSLEGIAAWSWELLSAGAGLEWTAAQIAETFGIELERARADLGDFVGRMRADNLVVDHGGGGAASGALAIPEPRLSEYEPPELIVFTDMEELLAFDPPFPSPGPAAWESPDTAA